MEKARDYLLSASVFLFLLICIFDPTDPHHLKLAFYFISMALSVDVLYKNIKNKYYWPIYLMGILYTPVLVIQSTILTGDFLAAAQQAYPAALILMVIVIREKKIPYEKWLMGMLFVMVMITALIVISKMLFGLDLKTIGENGFLGYLKDRGIIKLSNRQLLIIKGSVFFKTGILMNILLTYLLIKKRWILAVITTFAISVSGTRANLALGFAVFGFGILMYIFELIDSKVEEDKRKKIKAIVWIAVVALAVPIGIALVLILHSHGTHSDGLKYAQGLGLLEILSNPKNLLLGQGFGSYFPDMGRDGQLFNSAELNYLDFLRKSGIIFGLPFFAFILLPFTWKIDWDKKIALLAYLIIALTNPYLYTSTAFILYIYIYMNRPEETWLLKR